jgi:quercetin dioxygenase-like cupin family protein
MRIDKKPFATAVVLALGTGLLSAPSAAAPSAAAKAPPSEEQRIARAIEQALQKHGKDVHRCFEKALADRLDVAGKLEVEVDVGAGGKVRGAKVLSQGKEVPAGLGGCVQASAAGWVIDGVGAGSAVVLPFAFQQQMNQFVVKADDVPDRGPPAPRARGGMKAKAPFSVKVLADPINVRAQHLSVTLLTVGPASRVAMHRHPRSEKILYLLKGHARVLGPRGVAPIKAEAGTAMLLPAGYPHVIENMGRQASAVFLQVFAPPGPERVYRDPADPQGRADFEVLRDATRAKAAGDARPTVATLDKAESLKILSGKGTARILLEQKVTGSPALALSLLEFAPGAEVPRHSHPGASEVLYVLSGGGDVMVGSEKVPFGPETAIHIPGDQPHGATFTSAEPRVAVQIYAPAGPEQRFRGPAAPATTVPQPPPK